MCDSDGSCVTLSAGTSASSELSSYGTGEVGRVGIGGTIRGIHAPVCGSDVSTVTIGSGAGVNGVVDVSTPSTVSSGSHDVIVRRSSGDEAAW